MNYLLMGRARSSIFNHGRDENENRPNLEGVVCNLAEREPKILLFQESVNTFPNAKGEKLASFSQTIRLFTSKVIIYHLLISMASHPQVPTATTNYNCQHQEAQIFQNNSLKSLILAIKHCKQ